MFKEKLKNEDFREIEIIKDIFDGGESCSCGRDLTISNLLYGDIKGAYKCICGKHYFVCNDEEIKIYTNYSYAYKDGFIINKDSYYGKVNESENRFFPEIEKHRERLYINIETINGRKNSEFLYVKSFKSYLIESKYDSDKFFEDFTVEDLEEFSKELKRLCSENSIKPNYGELMEPYCTAQNLHDYEKFFSMIFGDLFFELLVKGGFKDELMYNPVFSLGKLKSDLRINENETTLSRMMGVPKRVFASFTKDRRGLAHISTVKRFFESRNYQEYDILINKYKFSLDILRSASDLLDEGYSAEKLGKYIVDVCKTEGLRVETAFSFLDDLCRMSKELEIDFRPYSKNLRERHDKVTEKYSHVKNEKYRQGLLKATEGVEIKQVGDKYFAKLLKTPEEFTYEGDVQRNCVASYISFVVDGGELIFSVRELKNLDKPIATVEIRNNKIVQARGFANGALDEEIKLYLRSLAYENGWTS